MHPQGHLTLPTDTMLTQKEAAEYVTKAWFPLAPKTLRNMAAKDRKGELKGPPFYRILTRRIRYDKADLDAWAASNKRRFE